MEEKYKAFESFNWSDDRWQSYLDGLYPPPSYKQVAKFKKKWYKKNIDPEFDETYEPHSTASVAGSSSGSSANNGCAPPGNSTAGDSARLWAGKGQRATVCLMAYLLGLAAAAASLAGLVDTLRPLLVLAGAFAAEVVAKHGVQFNSEYLQKIAMDDVTLVPFLAGGIFFPGTHAAFRLLVLVPFALTAIVSVAGISFFHEGTPSLLKRLFAPISDVSIRYQLMQIRADTEVGLIFGLIVGSITRIASPLAPLMCGNVLMARYASSPWTQASFRKVDGVLDPVLGRVPGLGKLYGKMKCILYNFATGQQGGGLAAGSGRSCSVQ